MEESCEYHYSPYFHIKSYIKVFHILFGFPLKPVTREYDEFVFTSWKECTKLFVLLAIINPYMTLLFEMLNF